MTNPAPAIILAVPESAVGLSVAFKPNIDAYFERIGFSEGGTNYSTTIRIVGMKYNNAQPNLIDLVVQEYEE